MASETTHSTFFWRRTRAHRSISTLRLSGYRFIVRLIICGVWAHARATEMSKPDRSRVIHLAEAEASLPGPSGARAITLLRRGSLDVKLSARPLRPNRQTPHTQDEVYVVVRGRGVLFHDGKRDSFEPGDCLFVAAGTEHHFEDFSEDLAVWVI